MRVFLLFFVNICQKICFYQKKSVYLRPKNNNVMAAEQLLDSTWSDAVANDPKHRPQVMDFSEAIPNLSVIETELQSQAPYSFLLVLPKTICQKRYSQWCDLLFETLRHPCLTLRYGVSVKVLDESIYDKSSGKVYILGIKNV